MQLTTQVLGSYKGGQLEIQNDREGYIFQGEVAEAVLEDNAMKVKFSWLAKGKGFPPAGWVNEDNLEYSASLEIYGVSEIGEDRLSLNSFVTGELAVFYPPGGSRLDPARVEGLKLVA